MILSQLIKSLERERSALPDDNGLAQQLDDIKLGLMELQLYRHMLKTGEMVRVDKVNMPEVTGEKNK
jgi:hypothetical protein